MTTSRRWTTPRGSWRQGVTWAGLLVSMATSPAVFAGELVTIDGVLHVRNGAAPAQGREIWHLEEQWRVGGDDEDAMLLGLVTEVAADADGNLYIMDSQLRQVHVFSPEGELLRSLFREGEGPGEVQRPRDLVLLPDGVGLGQEFPARVTCVDFAGNPLESIAPGGTVPGPQGMPALTSVSYGGGHLVVGGVYIRQSEESGIQRRTYFLSAFDRSGEETIQYTSYESQYDFQHLEFVERDHVPVFWWGHAVDADGRVYSAPFWDTYEIRVYAADGTLERIIERAQPPVPRSKEKQARVRALYESAVASMPFDFTIHVEENEPTIAAFHRPLHLAEDGSLWVTTSPGLMNQPDGILKTVDVFDAEGHFVRRIAMACEGNSQDDGLFFVSDDVALLVRAHVPSIAAQFGDGTTVDGEDDEPVAPEVICLRVSRRE